MMNKPKIGIIISTTRDTRNGSQIANWLHAIASKRTDMEFELLDLRDFPMPFFNELASNAYVPSKDPTAQQWQKKIGSLDGYIFVTAEYNNSIPAVLKNALDYAYVEWGRKPAAYVGYGSVGGARAIQHLKDICVELQMAPVRQAVHLQGADFYALMQGQKKVEEFEYLNPLAEQLLEQLAWWAKALKQARV
ncbi:MAG: NAD(P)H-dependent oxidoreductase [Sphaerochaetaceae bacterium]|jgi:NAD(P)H-dependent FMN reductase|nr:NAD(P)H-dependent oxidoreductase [Sphaerochaetaceae bacterium]